LKGSGERKKNEEEDELQKSEKIKISIIYYLRC